jgi:hypothetical protein
MSRDTMLGVYQASKQSKSILILPVGVQILLHVISLMIMPDTTDFSHLQAQNIIAMLTDTFSLVLRPPCSALARNKARQSGVRSPHFDHKHAI